MAQQEDELESHHSTNAVFMIRESAISAGETYRGELLVPSIVKYSQVSPVNILVRPYATCKEFKIV